MTLSALPRLRAALRPRGEADALAELVLGLAGDADVRAAATRLVQSASAGSGATRALVVAGPEGQLPLLAATALAGGRPGRPGGSALVAEALVDGRSVTAPGLDPADEPWLGALLPQARAVRVVPLRAGDRGLGALVLEVGPLPARTAAALERSAAVTATALRSAWQLEQVQRLAATDGLTKIANRRTFESTLEREVARADRADESLSLVMLDLDHFKRLNDTGGHQAGDEVLRNVAAALSCECRDFDTAARYGGEEFAVVLPGCGADEAYEIAERLRKAVAAAPSRVPVTASAGVATYPQAGRGADALVQVADAALYRSKHAGRDRTTIGVPQAPAPRVGR